MKVLQCVVNSVAVRLNCIPLLSLPACKCGGVSVGHLGRRSEYRAPVSVVVEGRQAGSVTRDKEGLSDRK